MTDLQQDDDKWTISPPVMNWEEIESGKPGQLNLKGMSPLPTIAERAFLTLARRWRIEYEKQDPPRRFTNSMGDLELACLLLSAEWGKDFTSVALAEAERNRDVTASHRQLSWMYEISWALCLCVDFRDPPSKRQPVQELTVNLDHHASSIRTWMHEIAWCVFPWLNAKEALPLLLKNLADKLEYESVGLAARFFDNNLNEFLDYARKFKYTEYMIDWYRELNIDPSSEMDRLSFFESQYQKALSDFEQNRISRYQASYWETEAICRKEIEAAVLLIRECPPQNTT